MAESDTSTAAQTAPNSPSVSLAEEGVWRGRFLCLCEDRRTSALLADRLGPEAEVVAVRSPAKAVAMLATGGFQGVYADAARFASTADATQLLHNIQMLRGMPDAVVLLDRRNTIVWGNGRLREWTGVDEVVGKDFYEVLGGREIVDGNAASEASSKPQTSPLSEAAPIEAAFSSAVPVAATLLCRGNRYFRVHAAPAAHFEGEPTEHLVVTVREVTSEQLQQQKLAAIHQAGIELADLTPDEVANMAVEERIELLKENIIQGVQEVLAFDVVEVRTLDEETRELRPLLASGILPEAQRRVLRAEPKDNGVTGYVAATGQSYLCEDTGKDPLYIEGAEGARSSLTVPLLLHDRVIGTFNVESPEPGAFSQSDRQFLEIFTRDIAAALNTMDLLAVEKATAAAASVEAIHSAVALPVDDILNDAVNVMEGYIGHEPAVVERLQRILTNARDIKQVIQRVGQSMAPIEARPLCVRTEERPLLIGRRVLVADADETVRSAGHDLLERFGCIVETVHDGKEAIYMVRNLGAMQTYDAILADIRLPDISGYDLLIKLQELMPQPPLILMTGFGYDPGHSIVKARQAGLKAVLYKPFRLDQLLETVEQVVGSAPPDAATPTSSS
ncbi:response regulator [Botrimarina hoheduenensis]|uniref:Transcriptional regulatory protein ZraR n=1 Tax=Botrimarina hoheduenensis TaxID=2528000 RepID=A0A5C5WCZ6_9BACT|nr:response regulator [Botrimarina hoheduenensis]TWT48550.1 Transcriptional regulatory protein ZraR [Botrimarina hoheduenensis]